MKYEFGGPLWCAALHGMIAERVATLSKTNPNLTMSICEVFNDAPERLAGPSRKLAWSCIVEGGKVDFRPEERDDVRVKVTGDWASTVPLGQFCTEGDPERAAKLQSMVAATVAAGKLSFVGDRTPNADSVPSIHDAIARVTA